MTLIKFKPGRTYFRDSMMPSQMLSSMFENFFNEGLNKFEQNVFFTPRADVIEHDKSFELQLSLPGLKKEEINLEVNGDVLTISGERKIKHEQKESKYHSVESYYGSFSRSFTLPETANKQAIEAEFTDGILKIAIPKAEAATSKSSISIK
jgi:HSP20 family protein